MRRVPRVSMSMWILFRTRQEEFFLVLSGTGVLRTPEGERTISAGAFFSKQPGPANCHSVFNPGPEPLVLLDVGTRPQRDLVCYPDEEITLRQPERRAFYQDGRPAKGWSSAPNEMRE
ncbi:cupin domain-containing protein [Pseudoflavonifractor sp. 524-17]|nr:cupin domain-containing protein [Pseudoflavonifractor sp. 524-17]